jgi:hypothetical protein
MWLDARGVFWIALIGPRELRVSFEIIEREDHGYSRRSKKTRMF